MAGTDVVEDVWKKGPGLGHRALEESSIYFHGDKSLQLDQLLHLVFVKR